MPKKTQAGRRFVADATITNFDLTRTKSAIRVRVFERGEKFGELEIGRGSLMWYNKKGQKGPRVRWQVVAEMFNELAPTRKRKKR
jgi:hypothetical protein